jgi:hypothetical protein
LASKGQETAKSSPADSLLSPDAQTETLMKKNIVIWSLGFPLHVFFLLLMVLTTKGTCTVPC